MPVVSAVCLLLLCIEFILKVISSLYNSNSFDIKHSYKS